MDVITLELMKSFEFNKPMTEIILFEDSEKNEEKPLKTENDVINTENHIARQNNSPDYRSMPKIDDIETCNGETNSVNNKRRFSDTVDEGEEVSGKKKSFIEKVNDLIVLSKFFTNTGNNSVKANDNAQKEDNKCQNKDENIQSNVAHSNTADKMVWQQPPSRNLERTVENNDTIQRDKENFEELTEYIKDILNSLSHNLILSVEAYRQHLDILHKPNQTSLAINSSKKRYFTCKNQYFHLSYIAVVSLIFPQEKQNNTKFTDNFLNNTVKYAKEKMNLTYSKQDLQPIYYELINWATKKQESLKNSPTITNQGFPTVNLNEHMKEKQNDPNAAQGLHIAAPAVPQNHPTLRRVLKPQSNTLIFSAGSPEGEISISVDTAALQRHQNSNMSNVEYRHPAQNQNHIQRLPPNVSVAARPWQFHQYQEYSNAYSSSNVTNAGHNVQQFNSHQPLNSANRHNNNNQHYQRMAPPPPYYNPHSVYAQQQQISANHGKHHSQQVHPNIPHIPPPQQQYQISTTVPALNLDQYIQDGHHNQTTQVEQSRSSVSTDSGFASPLQFNTGADGEVAAADDIQSPIITHVTSLNPSAQYISEGICHVCGVRTHQKCLGCMQKYYCSNQCQVKDWDVHKMACRNVADIQ